MRSPDRRPRAAVRLSVDVLEGRALLSAGLQRGGVLDVRGSNRDDVIAIRLVPDDPTRLQVVENGRVSYQGPVAKITRIRVQGLGGHDRIVVDESGGAIALPVRISGGAGDDTLRGGSAADEIFGDSGRNVVWASGGADTRRNVVDPDALTAFGSTTAFREFLDRAGRSRGKFGISAPGRGGDFGTGGLPATGGAVQRLNAPGYSNTNTQVDGIDEGDLIENDGRFLYVLSRTELLIVDAQNPDALAVRSRTTVEGSPIAQYLHDGRLTVISSKWNDVVAPPGDRVMPLLRMRGTGQVVVTVYDVSGSSAPSVLSKTSLDGWYADSRMVEGKLALIVQNDLMAGYWGGPFGPTVRLAGPAVKPVSDASLSKLVRKASMDSLLPGYSSESFGAGGVSKVTGLISQPQNILAPVEGFEPNLLSVVLIQTGGASPGVIGATSVVGGYASTIHMDATDLYLFGPQWDGTGERTRVQRLDIAGTAPRLVATGSFEGHLLNQFSADADGEFLRVATTAWTPKGTENAVQVLQTQGDRIALVGAVTGIAPGERIMSARFVDDRVYMVTFEQIDPLFTIDLADPTAPKVLGELKIPGFSRYLQPFGEGYLLGIGRDADPATGRTLGLKVSLFDVRDDSAPKELATYLIDTPADGWSWSDAEWDHHALGFFPELGVIAVPVQSSGPWTIQPDGAYRNEHKSELVLLKVGVDSGISLLGTVAHDSPLLRSARIGDTLFSAADLDMKAVDVLADALTSRGSVVLQQPYEDSGGGAIAF